MDHIQLYSYEDKKIKINVHAYLKEGKLSLEGQDFGKAAEGISGNDEYEYFYSLSKENTDKAYEILKRESDSEKELLDLVKERFSGMDGCKEFKGFCERNGLKCKFFSC
jgi:hypothetical protein